MAPPAPAAPATELPPPRTEYLGRRIAVTMHWSGGPWLLRETREKEENVALLHRALGVRPGDTVCDFGAGNGFHTLRLAKAVGARGKALGADLQPEFLIELAERARAAGLENVQTVQTSLADPQLQAGSCDLILLVDVYHELGYPERVLAGLRRALKPKGRLALVEFRAEDPEVPIKRLHKMSRAQLLRELGANGFRLQSSFDELPWQHLLFFEAVPAAAESGSGAAVGGAGAECREQDGDEQQDGTDWDQQHAEAGVAGVREQAAQEEAQR